MYGVLYDFSACFVLVLGVFLCCFGCLFAIVFCCGCNTNKNSWRGRYSIHIAADKPKRTNEN